MTAERVDHDVVEREVLEFLDAGELDHAATRIVEGFGPVVYGFMLKMLDYNETAASDAWSIFLESLWVGLDGFRRECRVRTWTYTLARNAVHRCRRDPRQAGRHITFPERPLSQIVVQASHRVLTTSVGLDTAEDQLHTYFRDVLSEDEQWLVVLRVQGLTWEAIAHIIEGGEPDDSTRTTARLRRQFSRLVQKLRERAQDDGVHL